MSLPLTTHQASAFYDVGRMDGDDLQTIFPIVHARPYPVIFPQVVKGELSISVAANRKRQWLPNVGDTNMCQQETACCRRYWEDVRNIRMEAADPNMPARAATKSRSSSGTKRLVRAPGDVGMRDKA